MGLADQPQQGELPGIKAPKPEGPPTVPIDVLARILVCSTRRIRQLAAAGVIPGPTRGRYDLVLTIQAYVPHLRAVAAGRGDDDLTRARTRLANEQAERLARENAIAVGKVVDLDEMKSVIEQLFGYCRARLLALPKRLAPRLAPELRAADARRILDDAIYEALTDLAATRVLPASTSGAGADSGQAADDLDELIDDEPRGRPKSKRAAKARKPRTTRRKKEIGDG